MRCLPKQEVDPIILRSREIFFLGATGGTGGTVYKGRQKKISFGSLPFFPRTFIVLLYCGKVYTPVHIIIYIS